MDPSGQSGDLVTELDEVEGMAYAEVELEEIMKVFLISKFDFDGEFEKTENGKFGSFLFSLFNFNYQKL